jgi:glucosamine-phosphate N-acetyltransferase
MEIVPLTRDNLTREILNILNQLADTRRLTLKKAKSIIDRQVAAGHSTFVGFEDDQPIAIGSLIVTERLIHNGKKVGHLEDIAIHKDWHGKGKGKELVKFLKKFARKNKCYKCILDCDVSLEEFYKKTGMTKWGIQMRANLIK